MLLENGADTNIIDKYGRTALQTAKHWEHIKIEKLLERHIRLSRTQKALQQLQASRLPVDYELSRRIGERLSRMPYNPKVDTRIRDEDENEQIADYLKTLAQYGGKKKRRKTKKKKRKKSKKKKK